MAQKLIQTQEQKQIQKLSQQQMLQVRLLEMPITELEQNISMELDDNPALETGNDDFDMEVDCSQDREDEDFDTQTEREQREEALDSALSNIGQDDEMEPVAGNGYVDDGGERVYAAGESFYDKLKEQMMDVELSDEEVQIMEYLIGSLDSDGLLRKQLIDISDELAVYHNVYCDVDKIETVLKKLQSFDPPGIGGRNLQECLLLQIDRKEDKQMAQLMKTVVTLYFDDFKRKHWDKIQTAMQLSDTTASNVMKELTRLNPKPGAAMGETLGKGTQQITPDFIVDVNDDGFITLNLNNGNMPELKVAPSFAEMLDNYKTNRDSLSRREKETLIYLRDKVGKAQGFIDAVRMRRRTLTITMRAIIQMQERFFREGDESDLRPMSLKDIAAMTGLDISTISRVCNIKYVQTKWGLFPLRFFFNDSYTTDSGSLLSTRKIKIALRDIIAKEDKSHPLSDETLAGIMAEKGYNIARRTVAKYREQLNIPVARMRKKIH